MHMESTEAPALSRQSTCGGGIKPVTWIANLCCPAVENSSAGLQARAAPIRAPKRPYTFPSNLLELLFPSTRRRPVTRWRVCSISCRGRGVVGRHWHDLDALDARPVRWILESCFRLRSLSAGCRLCSPPTHCPKLDLIGLGRCLEQPGTDSYSTWFGWFITDVRVCAWNRRRSARALHMRRVPLSL